MKLRIILCLLAAAVSGPLLAQSPAESGVEERVEVSLVLVDAVVLDQKGRTVPGLTRDDFELRVGDRVLELDTLDVQCPIGAADDPQPLTRGQQPPAPVAPGTKRRIVFAFDYHFLSSPLRPQVLEAAEAMLRLAKTPEEEVMIVALAWGVRVEQKFTSDLRQLVATLRRMEHDVTLWAQEFPIGASGSEYFSDLTTLMDVLGAYGGSKAVVLFSEGVGFSGQTRRDLWFNDVAMHAGRAQTAIYPSNPVALQVSRSPGNESLARLANQSGGRMPFFVGDMSVSYRRAQRDLSCRYTAGAYLDTSEGKSRQDIRLTVKRPGLSLRYPEMIKFFDEEEVRLSRARAAFVDAGPYENPLVRAFAFPARPASRKKWDTLLAVYFPLPVRPSGAEFEMQAQLRKGATRVDKYKREFHVASPKSGEHVRPVTIFGDTKLEDGNYRFTAVVSRPGESDIVTAEAQFVVPRVVEDLVILRGPLLARVVPDGALIRADPKGKPRDTRLDEILGDEGTFEPLLIHQVAKDDDLLVYWSACVVGKPQLKQGVVVKRTFASEDGETIRELNALPLALQSQGKNLHCHDALETVPGGTLAAGEYELEVTVAYTNGDLVSRSTAPVLVE